MRGKDLGVNGEAHALHAREYTHERHLHLVHQLGGAVTLKRLAQDGHERAARRSRDGGGGNGIGRLGQLSLEIALGHLRHGIRALGGIEEVGGHARVEEVGRVAKGGIEGAAILVHRRRNRGIARVDGVHEGLHVARSDAPTLERADEQRGSRVALELAHASLAARPNHKLRCGVEQRRLRRGLVEGETDPLPRLTGVAKRFLERGAREDLRQLERGLRRCCGVGLRRCEGKDATRHTRKAQLAHGGTDRLDVKRGELRRRQVEFDRRICTNGRDLTAEQGVVDVRAEVLAHLALDLVRMSDDLVQIAVLTDERTCLLGTDARHARDVVRGIALEAVEIRNEVRGDAVVEVIDALRRHDVHV